MADYRIFATRAYLRDLDRLPAGERASIGRKLDTVVYPALRIEPHAGPSIRKLVDWRPETWRYRLGEWRCFYEIDEKVRLVLMTSMVRRSEGTDLCADGG